MTPHGTLRARGDGQLDSELSADADDDTPPFKSIVQQELSKRKPNISDRCTCAASCWVSAD